MEQAPAYFEKRRLKTATMHVWTPRAGSVCSLSSSAPHSCSSSATISSALGPLPSQVTSLSLLGSELPASIMPTLGQRELETLALLPPSKFCHLINTGVPCIPHKDKTVNGHKTCELTRGP